jgi:predicted dinucleotide-binding enzyme
MIDLPRIAILGAGRVGTAIARVAVKAGYDVSIAASGAVEAIELIVDVLAHGAKPRTAAAAVENADVVFLAVPLHKFDSVDPELLAGKIVVDLMNYWEPVDGHQPEFEDADASSSEVVQARLADSRVIKTLNHIGYHEIEQDGLPAGSPRRRALAVAGDDPDALAIVMAIVERFGFDAIDAGSLKSGAVLQPGGSIFGVRLDAAELSSHLADAELAA